MNNLSIYVKFIKYLRSSRVRRLPGKMSLQRIAYEILRPNGKMVLNVLGLKMQLSLRDKGIFETLVTGGIYEPYEMKLFYNSISQGMTVMDIGANFGYYSLLAAKALKGYGEVYAFEPENEAFEMLKQNILLNNYQNIIPIRKGLSDKGGISPLFVHERNLGMHSIIQGKSTSKRIDIETTTLDEFIREKGRPVGLSVLKIDTEGAEGLVLKGAS